MFCDKCGSILKPKDGQLYCDECKAYLNIKISLKKEVEKSKKILEEVNEEDLTPTVKKSCKICGNNKAFFSVKQTRSSDEPPTKFFRCTKCGKTWRDYN